jgi:hypothetical protein
MLHSFRQGNRAEYLANYILSSFALSVPVPRPEDGAGVDFHCSLLRKDANSLFPYLPFNIQVKSVSDDVVSYGGLTDGGNWREHEINQLCQTDTPFLVGMVDIKNQRLDLFTTISRYFVAYGFNNKPMPRQVDLIPYTPEYPDHLGDGVIEELAPVKDKPGIPNKLWKLPIGQPIVSITAEDSEDKDKVESIKQLLEPYLRIDQQNAIHFRTGVGYFEWPLMIEAGQMLKQVNVAWGWRPPAPGSPASAIQQDIMARAVISLLAGYDALDEKQKILDWEPVIAHLPMDRLPPKMIEKLKEIWAKARS